MKKALANLREKFTQVHEGFDDFLAEHKDIADAAIIAVETGYTAFKGHEKLEMALEILLMQLHIPGPFAVMASQQIVDRVEAFIQKRFDKKRAKGEI